MWGQNCRLRQYDKFHIGNSNYEAIRNLAERFGIRDAGIGCKGNREEFISSQGIPEAEAMPYQHQTEDVIAERSSASKKYGRRLDTVSVDRNRNIKKLLVAW